MDTEEERTRYDRQVRLWGTATQQQISNTILELIVPPEVRLQSSKSLTATTPSGIVGEVCKNLVLAGVSGVRLLEFTSRGEVDSDKAQLFWDSSVRAEDLVSNFYARGTEIGLKRNSAMIPIITDLNPFVTVSCLNKKNGNIKPKPNLIFFEQYNLLELVSSGTEGAKQLDIQSGVSVASHWACVALGPFVVATEVTSSSVIQRADLASRFLSLLTSKRCATQPDALRVTSLATQLLSNTLSSMNNTFSPASIFSLAHTLVLDDWNLAMNEEVRTLIQTGVALATELLIRSGHKPVEEALFIGGWIEPCINVVDASVAGGLIAQKMINAIANPLNGSNIKRIYTFSTHGPVVEATVADWE